MRGTRQKHVLNARAGRRLGLHESKIVKAFDTKQQCMPEKALNSSSTLCQRFLALVTGTGCMTLQTPGTDDTNTGARSSPAPRHFA